MNKQLRRILVTGANGFIGKNLIYNLEEKYEYEILKFGRNDSAEALKEKLSIADIVIHLAGENRPVDDAKFREVNVDLTSNLCEAILLKYSDTGRRTPIVFSSSSQATNYSPYGRSKLKAEQEIQKLNSKIDNPYAIYRLPGVFGKWCKPNYNSVVATFCHNVSRGIPIEISDPNIEVSLVHVDDVVAHFLSFIENIKSHAGFFSVTPEYKISLQALSEEILSYRNLRENLIVNRVGNSLSRALYSTYVSYLPPDQFAYEIEKNSDPRGTFVEMLRTSDNGQMSYFTAQPGVTRGGHYHHTKTEKFLVVKGNALFRFRNILTDELVEFETDGESPKIVDTPPGWSHDITNIGINELVVMLWANENFDKENPDTIMSKVVL